MTGGWPAAVALVMGLVWLASMAWPLALLIAIGAAWLVYHSHP